MLNNSDLLVLFLLCILMVISLLNLVFSIKIHKHIDTLEKCIDTLEKCIDTLENTNSILAEQIDTVETNRLDTLENTNSRLEEDYTRTCKHLSKTTTEWKNNQIVGHFSEPVYVKSEANNSQYYTLKYSERRDSYHCTCPHWKYQKLHPYARTCKHLCAVRGDNVENARLEQRAKH